MAKFVLTAQIALQAPNNVGRVVNQIKRQLQGINVNINVNANTRTLNNVNNQLNTTTKAAKTAQHSISELGKSLGLAARRFGAIAIATGTFLSLSRAIKSSLGDAIEFERQLVNLSQVTGKSVQNLQDITKEITRLSTGLGVSSDQLLKTSVILAQAGLEASKTKAALEVLAKTELASSFDNITNTTEGAIAILSQFRREAAAAGGDIIYLERALGAINDVSKKFAVESSDLVAVIRRSGGAFEAAGGSLNELLALFTSVRATTRESAETIATGLRTIFTRIQRVDTIRQLQELGIALQDTEGKFVGPFEAIKRISEGLSGLDPRDFRFSAIVEELGGFRQIGKVIPLIKQFALAQDALNTAQGASSSLTKDAEIAQLSLANQLAKVREEFQALIRRFVDSSSFQTVARGALEFARALIRIADAISPLIPLIASLAAIQIGKGFIPALGALTGVARRNQGGKIHAFASGGFVPGSGNRDTVPAMLTPGEFVIRKSSVNKIGTENLQKLNRGGTVQKNIWDADKGNVAAVTLEDKKLNPLTTSVSYKDSIESLADSRGIKLKNKYQIDKFSISKNLKDITGEKLTENILDGAQAAMEQTASLIRSAGLDIPTPLLDESAKGKFAKSIGIGTVGAIFESIVASIRDPKFTDMDDQQRPFDFIGGLGKAASLFDNTLTDVNTYRYVDAKATSNAASGKSFKKKIQGQVERELLGTVGKSGQGKENPLSKIRGVFSKKQLEQKLRDERLINKETKGSKLDEWLNKNNIDKYATVENLGPGKGFRYSFNSPKKQMSLDLEEKFFGGRIQKFAKGGAASDTVPALLTPGEFVVNKKTAQEVGYGTLNRMNKTGDVQGFAKGGVVGYQRFASGGGPVQPSPLNVSSQGPPTANTTALAQTFDQLVQQGGGMVTSFNLLKSAVEEMQAAGVKFTTAEKAAIKQMTDDARKKATAEKTQIDSYKKLQQSQQDAKDRLANFKSGIEKTLGSMQQFVFLGSTVAALATQFSSLDEATNSAIAETLGMGASIVGVIGTVGDLILSTGLADTALKYFTASVTRAGTAAAASSAAGAAGKAGGGAAASAGLLGRLIPLIANPFGAVIAIVVAALAGFAAYIYFIQARARKVAENLRKSADTIADSIEKGKGGSTQEFVDLQVKAAQTVTDSYLTFGGLLDNMGLTSAKARQEEIDAVKRSAEAYIGAVKSISDVNQSLANIDLDKTLKPAEAAFKKIAAIDTGVRSQTGVLSGPSSQFQEIAKLADREGIRKPVSQITEADFSSDTAKAQFKLANDAITKVTEDFEKRIPESISLLQTQLEDSLQSVNFGQAATKDLNLDGVVDSFDTVLQQNQDFGNSVNTVTKLIQIEAQARADAARQAGKFVEAGNIEAAAQERVKVVQEAIQKQAVAFAKSQESALAFQAALEASTAQFKGLSATTQFISKLGDQAKQFGNRISTLGDIMSGEMPTFEVDQIQGLGNLSEIQDLDKFTQEVGKLGASMGPKGKELAGNLIQSADLMQNAKRELTGINFAEIGGGEESAAKTAFKKAFGDQLETIFGPQVGGKLRTVMEKRLEDAIRTASEGGGMVDPVELENILDPLKQMTEETRKMFEAYNNAQIEFVNQYNNTSKMLLEVMERDIDGRQKIVDIQNRGLERMDQATGRTLGFQEKEARRNASRGSRLGSLGLGALTGDIRGMGNALRNTNQSLEVNSQKIKQDPGNEVLGRSQRLLTLQANELKKALEDLTDQSDKASDIMGEIDKERGKRETLTKIVEDFVVGSNEERMSTVRQFQGIEFAAATGSLQGLQPEDRKATFGLLSQLADVDDGFKQLKENLVTRDAIAMGLPPELARALATKTPKEEQLLVELSNLTAQEIAAQQELNRINAEFGVKLSTEINNLSQKIKDLGSVIESKLNTEVAKAEKEQDADKALVAAEKAKQEALAEPRQKLSQAKTNRENKEKEIRQKEIELKGAREAAAAGIQQADEAKNRTRTWTDAVIENAPMAFGPAGMAYSAMGGPSPITSYRQTEISGYEQNITDQQTIASQREAELNALRQEQQRLLSEEQSAQEELKKAQKKARGGLVYRASGGSIFKPKGTDTIPAMLTPGEFVMQKSAVDKYGVGTMSAMNQGVVYASTGGTPDDLETYRYRSEVTDRSKIQKEMDRLKGGNYDVGNVNAADMYNRLAERDNELSKSNKESITNRLQYYPKSSTKQADFSEPQYLKDRDAKLNKEIQETSQKRRESSVKRIRDEQRQEDKKSGVIKTFKPNVNAPKYKTASQRSEERRQKAYREKDAVQRMQDRGRFFPNTGGYGFNNYNQITPTQSQQGFYGVGAGSKGLMAQSQTMAQNQIMTQGVAGVQGMNGGIAQGQGFNMEPLMQLKQTFDNLAGVLNNMQMTHTVNVDGALNINGVDAPQVAEAIKTYLGNFIVSEVNKIINSQGKGFKGPQ